MSVSLFQYLTGYTDLKVHVQPKGLSTLANATAFETYNSSHWLNYKIVATEGEPTFYYWEKPSWLQTGYYIAKPYREIDGTPANDISLGNYEFYHEATEAPPALPYCSASWICNNPGTAEDEDETRYLTAGDDTYIAFDFGNYPEIQRGETISTMALTVPDGVDYSDDICGGPYAMARFSGTASETAYEIEVVVNFSGGSTVTKKKKLKFT